ncbi:MAG: MFS transporter, partial [Crenarchaeota archaeon]|nr:MFS transporter [Thermoproteota archaeon]
MVWKAIIIKFSRNNLFLPSLAISSFIVSASNVIITLLLIEISATFSVNEGVVAQLRTINAIGEVAFGLFMGYLALRFKHKSLLLIGLSMVMISAVGSFLAPSLNMLLFFSFFEGAGSIMFTIIAFTLVGEFFAK